MKEIFNKELRAISILFYAMIAGTLFFSATAFGIMQLSPPEPQGADVEKIFLIVVSSLGVICFSIAITGYSRQRAKLIFLQLPLTERLQYYRAILIKYLAMCEGPAIFSVMCYFLTGNNYFFIITVVMLLAMLWKRPFRQGIITELQLSSQEQSEIA